jgi:hypothetical protein
MAMESDRFTSRLSFRKRAFGPADVSGVAGVRITVDFSSDISLPGDCSTSDGVSVTIDGGVSVIIDGGGVR